MSDYDPQVPTEEELAQVRGVTEAEAAQVDFLILGNCTPQWRKVAMVVAKCLSEFDTKFPHLPYIYMPMRILALVERGVLEAEGTVMSMRTSEVRLGRGSREA